PRPSARGAAAAAPQLQRVTMADRFYATGKRKTAVARVFISPGSGKITINKRPADDYFVRETNRMVMRQSLELIELLDQYDVAATRRRPKRCGTGSPAP